MNPERRKRLALFALPAAVVILTAAVYSQAPGFGFIHLDDFDYVIENPYVKGGLTWRGLRWAFTSFYACNWHPLTWLSHMLDCQLFGLNPAGHHVTNIILHLASTALLFLLLRSATGSLLRSAFVAAAFGVHPMHVESVAWISERKDVLSALFWMLTLWSYVAWTRRKGTIRYLMVLVFFSLGLMSKQMLVTLPFVLLLLDLWPLGRLKIASPADASPSQPGVISLVLEKAPVFFLAAAASAVAFMAQHTGGATTSFEALDFSTRLQNAAISYVVYAGKTLWPSGLGVYYPYPTVISAVKAAGSGLLILALTAIVLLKRKSFPYAATGWLWYLGTLIPVIGLVQIGGQAHADRYTYIPMIGLLIIAAWGGAHLGTRLRINRTVQTALAAAAVIALTAAGHRQASYWKESITLFERTISVTTNNWMAYNSLGSALKDAGRFQEAIESYKKSISIRPHFAEAHNNMGVALTAAGRRQEAEQSFRSALRIKPDYAEALDNLAVVLAQQGKVAEALQYIKKSLDIRPFNAKANNNMGNILTMLGKREEAVRYYNEALRIDPEHRGARQNLERLMRETQRPSGSPFKGGPN